MKYLKFFLIALFVTTIIYSCYKSKLNQPVPGLLQQQQLANNTGVQALLIGAYAMLDGVSTPGSPANPSYGSAGSNWIYGSICGSEAYTGSFDGDLPTVEQIEKFESDPSTIYFDIKWAAVYEGVQRANSALRLMREAKDMSTADTIEVRAEALFLRAHYHFEAKKMWNNIPFVNENITYNNNNFHVKNDTSWRPIENDLIYATAHLRTSQLTQGIGRANKYAAEALLAKAYMFEHKFAQAKTLLTDLIQNGQTSSGVKYALNDLYNDNFNAQTKNSKESVFAYQSSVNDGVGDPWGGNGNTGEILNFPSPGGEVGCCGAFQPSQYLVNHFKTDPVTGLPDQVNYNNTDVKNDEGLMSADPFIPDTTTLDPRLDWTVGRREIPYLDWGKHRGFDWVRVQSFGGPYSPKKTSVYKAQEGRYTANGSYGTTAININFIRFSDILLWAAEAEVEIGSLDQAESYVNLIRNRAANPAGFVHTYIDDANPTGGFTNTPAANYFIKPYPTGYFQSHGQTFARKAVYYERMLELGMEGHRFFDLVRWGIASTEINTYLLKEKIKRTYLSNAAFTAGKNEYFPISQIQIDLSAGPDGKPVMKQNPGY
ncbi:MAG TPA: RagB/SusD family nutrient uptake outer membrane protein [Mucilaginibacter sp.]|jgi:hypothetical protein